MKNYYENLLTEIIRAISYEIGGESYGVEFSNEVFSMRLDNDEECDAPNFYYKPLDLEVSWHKYIGRGMEFNQEIPLDICMEVLNNCVGSIKN